LNYRALICLALIHALVDGYSQLVTPLWPGLKEELGLSPWGFTALYGAWTLATSVSQPLFGYWGDRFGSRRLLVLGPAVAIVCLSTIGFAGGPLRLAGLLVLGGLGIGAFHPEAAAGVVEAAGVRATRGLTLFAFGGMIGLGLGPWLSGRLAQGGLTGLAWTTVPGLALLAGSVLCRGPVAQPRHLAAEGGGGLAEILDGRGLSAVLILAVATLRVVPALGVPLGLAFLFKEQGESVEVIGDWQSLFLLSGGAGTLVCPLLTRSGREVGVLVGTTLMAAGFLVLLTQPYRGACLVGVAGAGFLLQGTIPILIAYSQRLLPRGRRLASSLTLGASWGLGGLLVAVLQAYFTAIDRRDGMLWAMVPCALAAAVGSALLPRLAESAALAATEWCVVKQAIEVRIANKE
jgi:FSR family fosmidomycin resistance protein-like MFS transporter